MRIKITPLLLALLTAVVPAAEAQSDFVSSSLAQFGSFISPVSFTYTCPTQTATLPTCTTEYHVPYGRVLVVQDVNGSATPINPNTAGNFTSDQASLLLTTQVIGEAAVINTIGPHYAINNSAIWNFHELTTFYTHGTPIVQNNGGPVVIQGYLIVR